LSCPVVFWIGGNDSIWNIAINKNTDFNIIPRYGDITENVKRDIENSISNFYSLLDDFLVNTDLEAEFGIELRAYDIFKDLRSVNIKDYLSQGLKAFYKNDQKRIEESLFFYPLIGILNRLASELSQN